MIRSYEQEKKDFIEFLGELTEKDLLLMMHLVTKEYVERLERKTGLATDHSGEKRKG